jgi:hypothetical protein
LHSIELYGQHEFAGEIFHLYAESACCSF